MKMYSVHNERKSIGHEQFITTLRNKIYTYMTSVSKNVYIDKIVNIADKYYNKFHRVTKMRSIDVKSSTYIVFNVKINNKDPIFKIGDHV